MEDRTCKTCKDNDNGLKYRPTACEIRAGRGILQQEVYAVGLRVAKIEVVSGALQKAECNRHITGNCGNLLAAFLAVFGESFQSGDRHRQQLHDNGAVDIRRDRHCEDRAVVERVAGHHAQIVHEVPGVGIGNDARGPDIHKGNRDRGADPEYKENQRCKQHFLPQIGNLPRVDKGLKHVRSPRPFRLPPRSSVSRPLSKHLPAR